ncbi:MAG TPA: beta-glucosidase BglX [Sphingobium sp.]|uniref:beta-glucosidase BglX n=1 Tax=Sphingobium sp. TaxID=1912891 RepID=UPI002ED2B24F
MHRCRTAVLLLFSCAAVSTARTPTAALEARGRSAEVLNDEQIRARIDALLAQMTPQEKAGQLIQLFKIGTGPAMDNQVRAGTVGSLLFVTDPKEINRLQRISVEESRLKIPLLFGFDVIHGFRTIFPVPIANAASWDPETVEANQAIAAREARAVGIHWAFGPMVDIARDARWGRIVEGAGEDPYLGAAMAAAQVRGFQGARIGTPGRVIAGPKHFLGYGAALGGRDYDEANISDAELWNVYLPPFKAAIAAGAGNVMSAYMGLNGVPASANHWLLTDVLRGKLNFKGFVVSDADAVRNIRTHGLAANIGEAGAKALDAGVDMEMTVASPAYGQLPAQLASGRISAAQLDASVRRILDMKFRMGLFDKPYVDEAVAARILNDPKHRTAARIAAERAAVLLRNNDTVLPLDRRSLKSVALIGPLADSARDTVGPWVFDQRNEETITVLAGLRAKLGAGVRVDYVKGVSVPPRLYSSPFDGAGDPRKKELPHDDTAGIVEAVAAARAADVAVLVLGEGQEDVGEQASRSTLDLPGRQQELLDAVVATGKPVVVVLMSGRPLNLKESKAAAVLEVWYPGSQGGAAVANLLTGDAVPGGKLPFTWPRNVGQVPMIYARLNSHDPRRADKRYWNEPGDPAYPFGYGLSYATFTYSNVKVDRPNIALNTGLTVTADVSNTGSFRADAVAQLYLHQKIGTSARPVRELKGFQRVTLRPGETRTLRFAIQPDHLRYWSAVTRDWVQDASTFDVAVGGDSTAPFSATFTVAPPPR